MKMSLIKKDDKPREKLKSNGVINLSDSELLAIMLGVGNKDESVLDLSERLIREYGLKGLFDMSYDDLVNIKGIKDAKASKMICAFEITRRALEIKDNKKQLLYASDIYDFVKNDYLLQNKEILSVIYVDNKCCCIKKIKYTNENSGQVFIPEREIIKKALSLNCFGIFFIHNHPSGNSSPSKSDIDITNKMKNILDAINIHFLDHIIIAREEYYSIADGHKYKIENKK